MDIQHAVFGMNLTQVAYASNTRGCSQSSSISSSSSPVTSFAALSANKEVPVPDLTLFKEAGAKPLIPTKSAKAKTKCV